MAATKKMQVVGAATTKHGIIRVSEKDAEWKLIIQPAKKKKFVAVKKWFKNKNERGLLVAVPFSFLE